MQTLGLASESKRSDGWLKSIFWPTVQNAWDVDYLGQQGFWICTLLAGLQLGFAMLTGGGKPVLLVIGLFGALLYWSGGMGVREKSWAAAATVCAVYLLDTLLTIAGGLLLSPAGALHILMLGLLFSNLRATLIAREWRPVAEGEDRPQRFNESLRDKLVDIWPPKLWPILRIPFFVLGALWCAFSALALVGIALVRLGVLRLPAPAQ